MTGLPRFGPSNGYVLFAGILPQIPVSPEHPPQYERHGGASAQRAYIDEELIQLTIESGPKTLRRTFLSKTLKAAESVLNRVHASAP